MFFSHFIWFGYRFEWQLFQMEQTFLSIICRKNLPTQIWHRHFYHSAPSYRPKCLSTNKRIYQNVLDLFHMIIMIRHRRPSKQCMVFKLERSDWKFNWKNQKMPRSLIRMENTNRSHHHHSPNHTQIDKYARSAKSFSFHYYFFSFNFSKTVTMCCN